MDSQQSFLARLRKKIGDSGATQWDIATSVDKSQAWVGNYLLKNPEQTLLRLALDDYETLESLAKTLHTSPAWLLESAGIAEQFSNILALSGIVQDKILELQSDEVIVKAYDYDTMTFMSMPYVIPSDTTIDTTNLYIVNLKGCFLVQLTLVARLRSVDSLIFDGNKTPQPFDATLVRDDNGVDAVIRWGDNDCVIPLSGEGSSVILKNPKPLGVFVKATINNI